MIRIRARELWHARSSDDSGSRAGCNSWEDYRSPQMLDRNVQMADPDVTSQQRCVPAGAPIAYGAMVHEVARH